MTNNPGDRRGADVVAQRQPDRVGLGSHGAAEDLHMNADGTGQRMLVGEGCSDRPTWSRGPFNEIAYAPQTGPGYDIKMYSFATGKATKITDGIGSNESPAFAPNGRHIAFTSTRNGKAQIFTVDARWQQPAPDHPRRQQQVPELVAVTRGPRSDDRGPKNERDSERRRQ